MAVREVQVTAPDMMETGTLTVLGVVLSEAHHVVDEHGDHVFESTEFDVYAGGSTLTEALDRFGLRLIDYATELIELDEVTVDERRHREVLALRLAGVAREAEGLAPRSTSFTGRIVTAIHALFGQGGSSNEWRVQPTPTASLAT